jgi:hypothetical protein
MATDPKDEKKPESEGVTAAGMVEALEQDVELSIEQLKEAAHETVEAVEKKLGVGKSAKTQPPKAQSAKPPKPTN